MQLVTLDFETFWTKDYSLTKMPSIVYIKDERFEAISCAIKINNGPTEMVWGPQIAERLSKIDWANSAAVAHNGNEFDFPILVWRFDCHPKLFIDTAALMRPKYITAGGVSLKNLSTQLGLPEKVQDILIKTQGKRYIDLQLAEMRDMAVYNRTDTDNCYALLQEIRSFTPVDELLLSDMTARMMCYPRFEADGELLRVTLDVTRESKRRMMTDLIELFDVDSVEDVRQQLMSANKFADALRSFGVEPPTKISKTTNKTTYALAKTDEALVELLEHPDPRVQAITAARLDAKSTILETRLETMLACSTAMGGLMPIPLAYHAATTGRWGGRVINPQNLPRIPRDKEGNIIPKPSNALRLSLRAPKGHLVVVSDLSGIELRVNHYLWGVKSTQELYEQDPQADLYKEFAAALYGKPKNEVTKDERQLAKVAQLGLGFGAGAATFQRVAKAMGGIALDEVEAARVVAAWRAKYVGIVLGWRKCQQLVAAMHTGFAYSPDPRQLVMSEAGACRLPSGRKLYYPNLVQVNDESGKRQYLYGTGSQVSKVYAGLMDENLVQAIARDVIAYHALQIQKQTGYRPVHMVHDELVYVAPETEAHALLGEVNTVMRTPPPWLPGIVLYSEGDVAPSYGEAK